MPHARMVRRIVPAACDLPHGRAPLAAHPGAGRLIDTCPTRSRRFGFSAPICYRLMRGTAAVRRRSSVRCWTRCGTGTHRHSHQEGPSGPALDLVLALNGEWPAKEVESGVKDQNSGDNALYLPPNCASQRTTGRASCLPALPLATTSMASSRTPMWASSPVCRSASRSSRTGGAQGSR